MSAPSAVGGYEDNALYDLLRPDELPVSVTGA